MEGAITWISIFFILSSATVTCLRMYYRDKEKQRLASYDQLLMLPETRKVELAGVAAELTEIINHQSSVHNVGSKVLDLAERHNLVTSERIRYVRL